MKPYLSYLRPHCFVFWFVCLSACTSNTKTIVSDELPTMKEIYDREFLHQRESVRLKHPRPIQDNTQGWNSHLKHELKQTEKQFTFLPNPLLTMYIFPHLTDWGSPVPGYTTFFKFYERDVVGMPSELFIEEAWEERPTEYFHTDENNDTTQARQ